MAADGLVCPGTHLDFLDHEGVQESRWLCCLGCMLCGCWFAVGRSVRIGLSIWIGKERRPNKRGGQTSRRTPREPRPNSLGVQSASAARRKSAAYVVVVAVVWVLGVYSVVLVLTVGFVVAVGVCLNIK